MERLKYLLNCDGQVNVVSIGYKDDTRIYFINTLYSVYRHPVLYSECVRLRWGGGQVNVSIGYQDDTRVIAFPVAGLHS